MSFAGVSLIRDGRLWPSASATDDAAAASGYHLLVVEGYSRTKADVLNGNYIESRCFRVGGYLWTVRYYPNGLWTSHADFISAGLFIRRDDFEDSEHLKDDSFTIRCDVVVIKDVDAKATASPFVTVPPPDMQRHFADLLASKEGADVTFNVGGEKLSAHRCVLAARSRVFKAELFGPMKEGKVTAGVIYVKDMESQVFRAMLAFIYTDSEPELEKGDDEDVIWRQLLVAADRYDLQRLKLVCEDKLCGFINVNTTTAILALAERHGCDGLKKACYHFLATPGNVKAVVATDGFDHLISSSPSVVKELMAMLAP
nr:BTB/POZ and MATH domain-containing protein 1-like [Lolium perenne]